VIVRGSRQPLFDGARKLLDRGYSPDATLVLRHQGAPHDAIAGQIGQAAALTVDDNRNGAPRLRRWRKGGSLACAFCAPAATRAALRLARASGGRTVTPSLQPHSIISVSRNPARPLADNVMRRPGADV